jgi:hypothetical protein
LPVSKCPWCETQGRFLDKDTVYGLGGMLVNRQIYQCPLCYAIFTKHGFYQDEIHGLVVLDKHEILVDGFNMLDSEYGAPYNQK